MSVEIERKYLVKNEDFIKMASHHLSIKQGYLNADKDRNVRVRILGHKAYITVKGGSSTSGLTRFEWEQEIELEDANSLLTLSLPSIISKQRFYVNCGNHTWEIDLFHGDNKGLVLAEIELQSESEVFLLPSFIGEEVSGDQRYYNSYLSKHPYTTWPKING